MAGHGAGCGAAASDVDLFVLIRHEAEFEQLRAWLVAQEQFHAPASSAFCLNHKPMGVQVDLMPFGGLADAIPREWWQALARQGDIEFLARRMANQLGKTNGIAALPLPPRPRPLPNSYWATSAVLGCEYPGDLSLEVARTKIRTLLEAGITDFIDLTNPGELTSYEQQLTKLAAERGIAVRYRRFAIPDVDVPTLETLEVALTALDKAVAAGGKAVVHCWGGVGRTGTVIGCYLARHQHMSGPHALSYLAQQWKGVAKSARKPKTPVTAAEFRLVEEF